MNTLASCWSPSFSNLRHSTWRKWPKRLGVMPERIVAVIEGARPMDAELDLRLSRHFRMSKGFFLRLQDRYEIVEAKRVLNSDLDRIVPHAA